MSHGFSLPRLAVVAGLIALASLQLAFVVSKLTIDAGTSAEIEELAISIGDDLRQLDNEPLDREDPRLSIGAEPLVLAVFNSRCQWCDSVAPHWANWMREHRDFRIVAVTTDSPSSALQYVDAMNWNVEVFRLSRDGADADGRSSLENRLIGRTPWLFVTDWRGRVAYEGHGSRVAEADSVARALMRSGGLEYLNPSE